MLRLNYSVVTVRYTDERSESETPRVVVILIVRDCRAKATMTLRARSIGPLTYVLGAPHWAAGRLLDIAFTYLTYLTSQMSMLQK